MVRYVQLTGSLHSSAGRMVHVWRLQHLLKAQYWRRRISKYQMTLIGPMMKTSGGLKVTVTIKLCGIAIVCV